MRITFAAGLKVLILLTEKPRTVRTVMMLLLMGAFYSNDSMAQEENNIESQLGQITDQVEALNRLKVTGYVQAQWNYVKDTSNFQIRRARLKTIYNHDLTEFGIQLDAGEKGVYIKDAYGKVTDPWTHWVSLLVGMTSDNPFGYEAAASSASMESPERSRFTQSIQKDESVIGAMLTIQGPKGTDWEPYRLDFAVHTGTGNKAEFDRYKDYVVNFEYRKTFMEKINLGAGISYYNGGFASNDTLIVSEIANGQWVFDSLPGSGMVTQTRREYYGGNIQFAIDQPLGLTTIKAEMATGTHPNNAKSSGGVNELKDLNNVIIYERPFTGWYVYLVQNILQSKFQLVGKIDVYDPNIRISGNEVANSGDLAYTTISGGVNVFLTSHAKICLYYDHITNETSNQLSKYSTDLNDDVFTARLQVKF